MFPSKCVGNVSYIYFWQICDRFLLPMFPKILLFWWWKCVRKVSEGGKLTDFWQISLQRVDTVLTHFWIPTNFWHIFWTLSTLFWHIFEIDRFLTVSWHIADSFLTDLHNWQISDRFLTDKWHILRSHGTTKIEEYREERAVRPFGRRRSCGFQEMTGRPGRG